MSTWPGLPKDCWLEVKTVVWSYRQLVQSYFPDKHPFLVPQDQLPPVPKEILIFYPEEPFYDGPTQIQPKLRACYTLLGARTYGALMYSCDHLLVPRRPGHPIIVRWHPRTTEHLTLHYYRSTLASWPHPCACLPLDA